MVGPLLEPIVVNSSTELSITNLSQLPREILEIIFCHLPRSSLIPTARVCKKFNTIIQSKKIKYTFYSKYFRAVTAEIHAGLEQSKKEHEAWKKNLEVSQKAEQEESPRIIKAEEIRENNERIEIVRRSRWFSCCC